MLPSEVIVETVEVALSRPTLVVRFDNALLFTVPIIGYNAAVGVPSCIRLYIDALCMALASVDIFHAVTATEEHVRQG